MNDEISIGINIQIKTLLDRATPELTDMVEGKLADHYRAMVDLIRSDRPPFRKFIEKVGVAMDKSLSTFKDPNIKCKKGCAYCCHINVEMTLAEAIVIVSYCRLHGIPIDEAILKLQDVSLDERMYLKEKACVFLDADNTCKIYAVRPFSCRRYFVVSDTEKCNVEVNAKGQVKAKFDVESEIIASALLNMPLERGNMSQMILKALNT